MIKSYRGLNNALKTAKNIIQANLGLKWGDLLTIFSNDPIIEPYYIEVTDIIIYARNSLRFENDI